MVAPAMTTEPAVIDEELCRQPAPGSPHLAPAAAQARQAPRGLPRAILDQVEQETAAEFDFVGESARMDAAAATLSRPSGRLFRVWKPSIS